MAHIITITSGKGGVGKTTTCVNIATGLSRRGRNVLVVDCDIGLRNLDIALGVQDDVVYDFVDVLDKRATKEQGPIKCGKNLDLLAAPQINDREVTPIEMKTICKLYQDDYDYIFLDCPAGIGAGFKMAIAPAEMALVVVTPDLVSGRDADRAIGLLERESKPCMLIVNRVQSKLIKKGKSLNIADIVDMLSVDVIGVIAEDENLAMRGNGIVVGERKSKAGRAFSNIVARLEGESVPLGKI